AAAAPRRLRRSTYRHHPASRVACDPQYNGVVGHQRTTIPGTGGPRVGRSVLLVLGEGHLGTYPLPDGGELTVGRDAGCAAALAHRRFPRRPARFRGGPPVEVQDLGSTNGVRVDGQRLPAGEWREVRPGTSVQVGPFVAVVVDSTGAPPAEGWLASSIPISDPTPAGVPDL